MNSLFPTVVLILVTVDLTFLSFRLLGLTVHVAFASRSWTDTMLLGLIHAVFALDVYLFGLREVAFDYRSVASRGFSCVYC